MISITFYIYALAFMIIVLLSLSLEMITVKAPTRFKEILLSIDVFFLVLFLTINFLMVLSLFWEVIKIALFKRTIKFKVIRLVFVICILIGSGIWVVVAHDDNLTNITIHDFVKIASKVSWCCAFGVCLLGSLVLRIIVFKTGFKGKAALVLYVMVLGLALLFAILGPVFFVEVVDHDTPLKLAIFTSAVPIVTGILITIAYFRGRSKNGKLFIFNRGVCLFFLGLFFFTVISTTYLTVPESCSGSCREKVRQDLSKKYATDPKARYEICKLTWTKSGVNVGELAYMANLTYNKAVDDEDNVLIGKLANSFSKKQALPWNVSIYTKSERKVVHFKNQTTHIIAIKGPVTTKEFARDAKLWLELGVVKAVGSILPFIEQLPADFISQFVSHSTLVAKIFQDGPNTKSFQDLEQLVKTAKSNSNDVILVGHSLAGGLAKIIGARQQIPAVSFSSPGTRYSHVKFEFSQEDASKTGISISPENDLFSRLDRNAGIEQRINCDAKVSGKCHLIAMTYCQLHNVCGQGTADCVWMMDN